MDRMLKNSLWGIVLGMLAIVFSVSTTEATDLRDWSKQINKASRFKVLKDFNFEAVLDNETQLVWEQSPGDTDGDMDVDNDDDVSWKDALLHCAKKTVGGRKGWRLPAFYELASLVDPTQINPALPPGHPFANVQSSRYWSATTVAIFPEDQWHVNFLGGDVLTAVADIDTFFVWCVRGGSPGPSEY